MTIKLTFEHAEDVHIAHFHCSCAKYAPKKKKLVTFNYLYRITLCKKLKEKKRRKM